MLDDQKRLQRSSMFRSGFCAGQSSFSPPDDWICHFFNELRCTKKFCSTLNACLEVSVLYKMELFVLNVHLYCI